MTGFPRGSITMEIRNPTPPIIIINGIVQSTNAFTTTEIIE